MKLGIDVSNHQGHIDWALVARSGVTLAMVKVSEGRTYVDKWAATNIEQATAAGLMVGGYHYALPSEYEPELEAEFFAKCLSVLPPVTLTAIDLEDPAVHDSQDLGDYTLQILQSADQISFHTPRLYSSEGYLSAHAVGPGINTDRFKLWLASWGSVNPNNFHPWSKLDGWQFTSKAVWPGVGLVDMSLWDY
jgi:GH25 family lysozyme M1 (1,4-beta-N-acetylmuramidase)